MNRYVIQYRHPRRGWTVWHTSSLRRARRRFATVTRKGWPLGSRYIRNVALGFWELP